MPYVNVLTWSDKQKDDEQQVANQPYNAEGVSDKRLAELLSPYNALGKPVIRWVDKKEEPVVEEEQVVLEKLTVKEIKERLDEKGIEYKSDENKQELIKKLEK